jgi:hypothetical protein
MRKVRAIVPVLVALAALAAACNDDGAGVREADGGTGTGTGSATGTGTGTGTGTATGTGTGTGTGVGAEACKPVGDLATAATRVNVALNEWTITPEATSAPAGAVGFVAQNEGKDPHELVIVRGVAPTDLPVKKDGSLDEEKLPAGALVGEIESFPAGTSCNGVFDLTPGEYTLVCNVVEEEKSGKHESHLKEGMVTTFTVT